MALRIWVVDAFGSPGLSVQQSFSDFELKIFRGSTKNDVVIPKPPPHMAIVTLSAHDAERDLAYVRRIRATVDRLPIIGIAVNSSEDLAIAAFRAGCRDYLKFPYAPEELSAAIERCIAPYAASTSGCARSGDSVATASLDGLERVVGASPAIRTVRGYISKFAATSSTVLITGETGTGKELVAELLHRNSRSADRPFVTVNCAAIPDTLIESELLGYEKGAFTGAVRFSAGKLLQAGDGTLFFDEVGDMSPFAQAKILRAIESREAYPLGGRTSYPIKCRFIAATNCDLESNVADGRFRKDFYYRLNVARIRLPPLRERKRDIPIICRHFITEFNRQFGREVEGCDDDVTASFLQYDWPGNVRELRNLLEVAYLNKPGRFITRFDLLEWFSTAGRTDASECDRNRLVDALVRTDWNKSKAAEALNLSRMTLYRKIAKYGVSSAAE
ncbi:MAG TPA: sigma-54 dependent transcriptional regulator [Bryobacteraceae bacterium]|nr:sigma-54 dependent transcriptional regulator [Bryobacteraceae bacterium]